MLMIIFKERNRKEYNLKILKTYYITKKSRQKVAELIRQYSQTLGTRHLGLAVSIKLNSTKQTQCATINLEGQIQPHSTLRNVCRR